ncbi:MAG: HDIG domain-containing protein, partial [Bacteroidales bacterium]|nr:HDIG domain-containing protein [Bacteroidales bacterium]
QLMLIAFCLILVFVYLKKYFQNILYSPNATIFILLLIVVFTFITSLIVKYRPVGLYMIPFAIMPILLKTFFESRIALFVYLVTILLIGFLVPNSFEFIFLNLTAGIVAIMSLSNVYRRNKMFLTSAWVIIAYFAVYTGISLYQEGSLKNLNIDNLFYFAGNGLLIMSTLPLIYICEKMFGFLSDATLLELSDTNQPLLRMLAEKAPGTFQHSLQVANLAEEAVYKIGGNPLLVRAGALYHDIGKMENPAYFIENLSDQSNPHERISFEESAKIIIEHVSKGVELALKYHLPEAVIHFIRTHHGTTMAHYFYHAYIRMHPDTDINPEKFTYPGPKPFSREMAVIMMADSIEAASRSLKKYTEKDIHTLVDNIVDNLLRDKQLNDTNLTLKDIEMLRNTFKKRLMNIYHTRIEYPGIFKVAK